MRSFRVLITGLLLFVACLHKLAIGATYEAYPVPPTGFDATSTNIPTSSFINLTGDTAGRDKGIAANINMGMTFLFGNTPYTQVGIITDGLLKFNVQNHAPVGVFENQNIPYGSLDNYIGGFWDDLEKRGGGHRIAYGVLGAAPNRRFVVEWWRVRHYNNHGRFTFQTILYETTREVRVRYGNLNGYNSEDRGRSATIGLEINDTDSVEYSYNTAIPIIPTINPGDTDNNPDLDILFTPSFPAISNITYSCGGTVATLTFAAAVPNFLASDINSYSIDNGATINSVTVVNPTTVDLNVSGVVSGPTYTVSARWGLSTVPDTDGDGDLDDVEKNTFACTEPQFPPITNALANCDTGAVEVNFSSTVNPGIIGVLANYTMDNGITISNVNVVDADTVTLTTDGFTPATVYQLSVQNTAATVPVVRTLNFTCAEQFPTISTINADCGSGDAVVTFSSNVSAGVAGALANYSIDNGITVSSVTVDSPTQVTLSTDGFISATNYQLTVQNTATGSVATVRTGNFNCQVQFPPISTASGNCNSGDVTVDFSSPPDAGIIGVLGNYAVDNGITVSAVTVVDPDTVTLSTDGFIFSTTYQVSAQNTALGGAALVRTANFNCVAPDFPDIVSATTDCGAETVTLVFSANVDSSIASDAANYSIDNGVTVVSAVQQPSLDTVLITTSGITSGIDYLLTATNVKGGPGAGVEIITFDCNNSPGTFGLYKSFSGNLTYRTIGNTLRAGDNGTPNECVISSSSSRSLTIPNNVDTTIKAAYLYWAGSGRSGGTVSPDFDITFNTNALTADRVFYLFNTVPDWRPDVDYFGAFKDISTLGIVTKGTNTYTFGDLAVDTNYPWEVGVCIAGWALIVVYEESGVNPEPFRVVNIYDGFDYFYNDATVPKPILDLSHDNFLVGADSNNIISGQITHVTWDGDRGNTSAQEMMGIETAAGSGTFVRISDDLDFGPVDNDNDTSNVDEYNSTYSYPNYDASHNFNGTYTVTNNVYGADIDTYYISGDMNTSSQMLFPYYGTTGFANRYRADRDLVILSAIAVSVTNQAIADIEIFKANASTFTVGGTGSYTLRVQNNGDGTLSGSSGYANAIIQVTDTMPAGLTITLPVDTGGDGNWDCSASTTSAVDCTYDLINYIGGAVPSQLSTGESLPVLTVNVSVAGSGTFPDPVNYVTNIARVVHSDYTGPPPPNRPAQFDNVNEGDVFTLTAKTPTNNNVDSVVTAIVQPSVDHYGILINKTEAVSCEAITVTIEAHEAHASMDPPVIVTDVDDIVTITANVLGSPKGVWYDTGGTDVTAGAGVTSYTFSGSNPGTVTFHYNNIFAGAGPEITTFDITSNSGSTEPATIPAEDPSLTLNRAGFRYYHSGFPALSNGEGIPDWIAGMPSNENGGTLYVQAIKTADLNDPGTNVGACVPLFDNVATPNVTIQMAAECKTPAICYTEVTKPVVVNGVNLTPADDNGGSSTTATFSDLTFDFDSESKATLTLRYDDVGLMELHTRYDIPYDNDPTQTLSGVLMTGSSEFIMKPFGFDVDFDNDRASNPPASQQSYAVDQNGSAFKRAGELFNVTVSSVMWQQVDDMDDDGVPDSGADLTDNTVTAKFGLEGEGVTLTHALVEPTGPGTSAGTLGGTTSLADNDFYIGGPPITERGTATVQISWSEVGIIHLFANLTDNNYLAGGVNVTGTAANVGRFFPDHYEVATIGITNRSAADLAGCIGNTFTHMGEAMGVDFTLTAKGVGSPGATTVNYSQDVGLSMDFTKLSVAELNFGARDSGTGDIFLPTDTRWDSSASTLSWSLGVGTVSGDLVFNRSNPVSVDGPFENFNVVTQAADMDGSGIGTASIDFDLDNNATDDSTLIAQTILRFGRVRVLNSFGPEIAPIDIPLLSEYWGGTKFITNVDDDCTNYDSTDLSFVAGSYVAPLAPGDTNIIALGSTDFIDGKHDISAPLQLTAPGDGNHGSVDVELNVDAWLRYDWDGDSIFTDMPVGKVTFGRYRGQDRVIYWHEITQ